jgi:hypothetical protein
VSSLKFSRNAPCPCGSGRKYKRCCIEDPRRVGLIGQAAVLPTLFPVLRPESEAFDAWVDRVRAADPAPPGLSNDVLHDGMARVDEAERERIAQVLSAELRRAWRSLCDELGDEPALRDAVLTGAVAAALHEERSLDPAVLDLLEDGDELRDDPADALALALDATDLWSVVEATAAEAACDAIPDEVDDDEYEARWQAAIADTADRLWTDRHARRLAILVGRVRSRLPDPAFSHASAILAEACERVSGDENEARVLGADLLGDTLGALRRLDLGLAA